MAIHHVSLREANKRLSQYIEMVSHGALIIVTKKGRPVARRKLFTLDVRLIRGELRRLSPKDRARIDHAFGRSWGNSAGPPPHRSENRLKWRFLMDAIISRRRPRKTHPSRPLPCVALVAGHGSLAAERAAIFAKKDRLVTALMGSTFARLAFVCRCLGVRPRRLPACGFGSCEAARNRTGPGRYV